MDVLYKDIAANFLLTNVNNVFSIIKTYLKKY